MCAMQSSIHNVLENVEAVVTNQTMRLENLKASGQTQHQLQQHLAQSQRPFWLKQCLAQVAQVGVGFRGGLGWVKRSPHRRFLLANGNLRTVTTGARCARQLQCTTHGDRAGGRSTTARATWFYCQGVNPRIAWRSGWMYCVFENTHWMHFDCHVTNAGFLLISSGPAEYEEPERAGVGFLDAPDARRSVIFTHCFFEKSCAKGKLLQHVCFLAGFGAPSACTLLQLKCFSLQGAKQKCGLSQFKPVGDVVRPSGPSTHGGATRPAPMPAAGCSCVTRGGRDALSCRCRCL